MIKFFAFVLTLGLIIIFAPANAQQYQMRAGNVIVPSPAGFYPTIGGDWFQGGIGEGVFYLPPNAPQVLPGTTLILGAGISVEGGWPPNMVASAGPIFLSVDHRSQFVRCSHYPALQDCPAIASPTIGSQFSSLTTIPLLDEQSLQTQQEKLLHPSAPVFYQPGDAIVFDRPVNVAVQARGTANVSGSVMTVTAMALGEFQVGQVVQHNPATGLAGVIPQGATILSFGTGTGGVGTYNLSASSPSFSGGQVNAAFTKQVFIYANIMVAYPQYTSASACSSDVKLLLHPKSYLDPVSGAALPTFVSDDSPSANPVGSTAAIDTTTTMGMPAAFPNTSVRFNGAQSVWANATGDQYVGARDFKFGMFWKPDDVAVNLQYLFTLNDGYGPLVVTQYGDQLRVQASATGADFSALTAIIPGVFSPGVTHYISAQRYQGNFLIAVDGVLKQTSPISGALFTNDHAMIQVGSALGGAFPARGNAAEVTFQWGSDGAYSVPTAPVACP